MRYRLGDGIPKEPIGKQSLTTDNEQTICSRH
nr:MAG TPA: hypothetical protein [Caudoviricetes sp.]